MLRARLYWRNIAAGVITTLAIAMVMSVLGMALGFTVVDPLDRDPFSGLGLTFGIWSVVSVVVSLGAGAFMAGYLGAARGCEYGFLVWATVLLVATLIGGQVIGAAARGLGSAAKTVGAGAASVVGGIGQGVAGVASDAIGAIGDNVNLDVDMPDLADVREVLRDTGVETLQPEYLRGQLRDARSDFRNALNSVRLDNASYDQAISQFVERQRARIETITADVDREAAVTALMNNRDIPRAEAEQTVDNALTAYNAAVDRIGDAMEEANRTIEDTRAYLRSSAEQARITADEMAATAAKSTWAAGLALIIGAVLSVLLGRCGERRAIRYYNRKI